MEKLKLRSLNDPKWLRNSHSYMHSTQSHTQLTFLFGFCVLCRSSYRAENCCHSQNLFTCVRIRGTLRGSQFYRLRQKFSRLLVRWPLATFPSA